jgi:hypothetical protein
VFRFAHFSVLKQERIFRAHFTICVDKLAIFAKPVENFAKPRYSPFVGCVSDIASYKGGDKHGKNTVTMVEGSKKRL